jgi:SAM-dependent methyltransferase
MKEKVTVNLNSASLYEEPDTFLYGFIRRLKYSNILRIIKLYKKEKSKFSLLEIGTGSGFLMKFIEKKYPQATLKGIEYDPRLVALTKSKVLKAEIVQGNAEDFDLLEKEFDLIVSLQVIEHLYRPEKLLISVKKHLNKDGVFIFTTPNTHSIGARIMKNSWHGYRDDHVSLKSYQEWKKFLEDNGFEAIYCGSTFFTGIPFFNKLPLGIINWTLLFLFGSLKWSIGESFVGAFKLKSS